MPLTKPLTWALRHQYMFLQLLTIVVGLLVLVELDLSPRRVSALLGVAALGGLAHRTIGWWAAMTSLERTLAGLLAATVIIGAIGTYNLDRVNAPPSGVVWYIIAHRVCCLFACAFWPILIGRTGTTRQRLGLDPHREGYRAVHD